MNLLSHIHQLILFSSRSFNNKPELEQTDALLRKLHDIELRIDKNGNH